MRSMLLVVASLALWAACACSPVEKEAIQHIPPSVELTQLATENAGSKSGAAAVDAAATKAKDVAQAAVSSRVRRETAGQESDLLPSGNEVDASPFGETSQLAGRGRIRVLPAYLG